MTDASQIHEVVQNRYGAIAAGVQSSCCGSDDERPTTAAETAARCSSTTMRCWPTCPST